MPSTITSTTTASAITSANSTAADAAAGGITAATTTAAAAAANAGAATAGAGAGAESVPLHSCTHPTSTYQSTATPIGSDTGSPMDNIPVSLAVTETDSQKGGMEGGTVSLKSVVDLQMLILVR